MISVLFVCLGNICRSPMAEGIFKKIVKEKGLGNQFRIDSAGTSGYHLGEQPDRRMFQTAKNYGIKLDHCARQFLSQDFDSFDYIIAMDQQNFQDIKQLQRPGGQIILMRDLDKGFEGEGVPDPYFGGDQGFHDVYHILNRSCNALLDKIITEKSII